MLVSPQETRWIGIGPDGLISEIRLFFRPLGALARLLRRLGPIVARRDGRTGAAMILGPAGALIDGVASTGDRRFVPLGAPPSARGR